MAKEKLIPPQKCLKCGSANITSSEYYRDPFCMVEEVVCEDCGHTWRESYKLTLTDIEEDPE